MNRIILHTFVVPPEKWTEYFKRAFKLVLNWLSRAEEPGISLQGQALIYSYPHYLIENLSLLLNLLTEIDPDNQSAILRGVKARYLEYFRSNHFENAIFDSPIFFLQYLPVYAITAFLSHPAAPEFSLTAGVAAALLNVLKADKRAVLLSYPAVQEHLPTLIKTSFDLMAILYSLNADQRTALLSHPAVQEHLPTIAKTSVDLKRILYNLNADQRAVLLSHPAVQENLPTLLKTVTDLQPILYSLHDDQLRTFLSLPLVQERLPTLLKTVADFWCILTVVTLDQGTALLSHPAVQECILECLATFGNLVTFFRVINAKQQDIVSACPAIHKRLQELLRVSHAPYVRRREGRCSFVFNRHTVTAEISKAVVSNEPDLSEDHESFIHHLIV